MVHDVMPTEKIKLYAVNSSRIDQLIFGMLLGSDFGYCYYPPASSSRGGIMVSPGSVPMFGLPCVLSFISGTAASILIHYLIVIELASQCQIIRNRCRNSSLVDKHGAYCNKWICP